MEQVVLIIGAVAYGLFFLKSILALFGYDSDFDIDMDFDGDVDFTFTDLVSFKGLIHFAMGLSTYLYPKIHAGLAITFVDWIFAILLGLGFVVGLCYLFKLCMRLQYTPSVKIDKDLVGLSGVILITYSNGSYSVRISNNGEFQNITAYSSDSHSTGDTVTIKSFDGEKYYI